MLLKLKGIKKVTPEGRTYGFYEQDPILKIINDRRILKGLPLLDRLVDEKHKIVFRQANEGDIYGTYNVATKLFGPTTPAIDRIPLFKRCPTGNVVVLDDDKVVSFAVILPMKQEPLMQFIEGKFRGSQITADHLDPFETGKVVDILIKSIGSHHESQSMRLRYSKMLFVGLRHEITRWGREGFIINRVYATSETKSGIELAADFHMRSLGRIRGSRNHKRYAFELDPRNEPGHPIFRDYCKALAIWVEAHPEEYGEAWAKWVYANRVQNA
jgi:hypothetical protein